MSQSPTSVRHYLPLQQPLRNKEDYQQARNLLAHVFQHYGNERLMMFIDEPFTPKDRWHDKKFHGMCGQVADETGNDAKDVKKWALSEEGAGWFLDTRTQILGKEVRTRTSWADLNEDQANYAIRKMEAWMAEHNIIPISNR